MMICNNLTSRYSLQRSPSISATSQILLRTSRVRDSHNTLGGVLVSTQMVDQYTDNHNRQSTIWIKDWRRAAGLTGGLLLSSDVLNMLKSLLSLVSVVVVSGVSHAGWGQDEFVKGFLCEKASGCCVHGGECSN